VCAILGCAPARGEAEFYDLVRVHKVVCGDTCDAVILAINFELLKPDLKEQSRSKLLALKSRAEYIRESSDLILRYITAVKIDEALFQEVLRNKFRENK
jgi:hypothetical protein